ncbi:MAG: DNA-3-methyladenine glycosylase [Conexibacter sp.]|nr:DNA-3-methyladenine glycosylase [Conexibacter sp.]
MTAVTAHAPASPDLDKAYDLLAAHDRQLSALITLHGRPDPFSWQLLRDAAGDAPLAELALHIVSQQISTAAALTIYGRVVAAMGGVMDAGRLLAASSPDLRAAGLSGAKSRSLQDLAQRVIDGRLDFERLARSDDQTAEAELEQVRGVGPWSAQMFLLHHLRRPDVFPAADIGLLRGAQSAFALHARPTPIELAGRAQRWRPLRSYAAALLWAHAKDLPAG